MKPINQFSQLKNLSFKELIYHNKVRAIFFQIATIVLIVGLFYTMIDNLYDNIEARGIVTGYSFLDGRAGFDILPFLGNYVVDFSPNSSNLDVFMLDS